MRAFRVKKRWISRIENSGEITKINKVTNQRDYTGIEDFIKYGIETYERYKYGSYSSYIYDGEVYEKLNNKWFRLSEQDICKITIT